MSQEQERQLRRLVTEIRVMEGTVQMLEQRLQLLNATVAELRLAQGSLGDLRDVEPESNLLVPVGGGVFVNARLGDISKIVVGVGAGVSVEMGHEEAAGDIGERLQEMEKAQESVQEQLGQIYAQLETHQGMAERLSAEIQNAIQGAR
ncbi:prefoldin subunit alpha [Candidatus Bathyarchaeota archaeon RBG_16_57_9]|nr:MAG: prefoldin subunit alpha [Candidatus Bathyarchaeota archaeon RBG_16_57_9]